MDKILTRVRPTPLLEQEHLILSELRILVLVKHLVIHHLSALKAEALFPIVDQQEPTVCFQTTHREPQVKLTVDPLGILREVSLEITSKSLILSVLPNKRVIPLVTAVLAPPLNPIPGLWGPQPLSPEASSGPRQVRPLAASLGILVHKPRTAPLGLLLDKHLQACLVEHQVKRLLALHLLEVLLQPAKPACSASLPHQPRAFLVILPLSDPKQTL